MIRTAFLFPITLLSACATIVNGSSQTVTLSTAPPGATCTVDRMGARIGAVAQTPGSLRLDKSKNDLTVTCSKPGFQTAMVTKQSSFGVATLGNVIAGGVIGLAVDAASGASYDYPADVRLDLVPAGPSALPPIALKVPAPGYDLGYPAGLTATPGQQRTPPISPVSARY